MTVRIGLIGCGIMGEDHARILTGDVPGGELAGVFDPSPERRARVQALAPGARVFDSPEALIADPGIDAVIIASPDATHAPLALAAIRAEKPALVEKPLGTDPETARTVVDAEVAAGRRLIQVGFMRRFDPGYRALRDTVVSGELGAPLFLHCLHRNAVAPDYIGSDLIIANSSVHEFDIARFVLGADLVSIAVTAARASQKAPARRPLFLVLEAENGAVLTVEAFLDAQYGYDVQGELVCETGTRALSPEPAVRQRVAGVTGHPVPGDWRPRFFEAYRVQLKAFVRFAAGTGPAVGSSAWDGYVAAVVAAAGLKALEDRRRVPINPGPRPALYAH